MRAVGSGILAALATRVSTMGWLMSIERRDGTTIRLNTIGMDLIWPFESETVWSGYPGFNMGQARFSDSLDPATIMQGSAGSVIGPVLFDDAVSGLFQGAVVKLYCVDWSSGDGFEIGFKWRIGTISVRNDGMISVDIWSDLRTAQSLFIKTFGPGCTADFGDERCGVDVLDLWTDSVVVSGSNIDAFSFAITGAREAAVDGWFQDGAVLFEDGENQGFSYDVRRWIKSTGVVTLHQPLRRPLANGTEAKIHKGCNKTTGAGGCLDVENNARYQGFKYLPDDFMIFPVEPPAPPPATAPGGIGNWKPYPGPSTGGSTRWV